MQKTAVLANHRLLSPNSQALMSWCLFMSVRGREDCHNVCAKSSRTLITCNILAYLHTCSNFADIMYIINKNRMRLVDDMLPLNPA